MRFITMFGKMRDNCRRSEDRRDRETQREEVEKTNWDQDLHPGIDFILGLATWFNSWQDHRPHQCGCYGHLGLDLGIAEPQPRFGKAPVALFLEGFGVADAEPRLPTIVYYDYY